MRQPRQGMVFELLTKEKILISYTGPSSTQEQWERYLECMKANAELADLRFLVFVEGSPPSAANQRRIAELAKREWPVALVSSSTAMRFVVSTFSLVNRSIRYFPPAQLTEALVHIHCTAMEALAVYDVVDRLRFED